MSRPKICLSARMVLAITALVACSNNNQSDLLHAAVGELSSPSLNVAGSEVAQTSGSNYVFADSTGTVDASNNDLVATFADPFLPLTLGSTSVFTQSIETGSCTSIGGLVPSVGGTSSNQVITQFSATGCTDKATVKISLDTTQIYDDKNLSGTDVTSFVLTLDLAPKVTTAPTGNSLADGTGATEATGGYFAIATDNSIVATFSKSLQYGVLTATLTGCSATLGASTIVANSSGTTLAWALGNLTAMTAGETCIFNVSEIKDQAGNADDPNDPNISTTITFH